MKWGDSMRAKIDDGLKKSKFGVAVLSPDYIKEGKYWTKTELDGLFQMESINGKTLLPIWHNLTKKEIMMYSPIIASKLGLEPPGYSTHLFAFHMILAFVLKFRFAFFVLRVVLFVILYMHHFVWFVFQKFSFRKSRVKEIQELPYVLSHKEKQLMWHVLFHRDKVRNWLFTVQMVRYGIKILMDMILSRRRVNIRERHTFSLILSTRLLYLLTILSYPSTIRKR